MAMKTSLLLSLGVLLCPLLEAQIVPNIRDFPACPNYPSGRPPLAAPNVAAGSLRKVTINAPNAVCNDGSPAVMYVRAARSGASEPGGPSANRWEIHFEGGGSCESYEDCGLRWCGLGFYTAAQMSSGPAKDFINPGGIFTRNSANWIADRNQVILNYCSSDEWQGRNSNVVLRSDNDPSKAYSLHYRGATIADAALTLLEQGVPGLPKLTDATDVLISGDSGGGKGVRVHLDRIAARLKAVKPSIQVLGMIEASFLPDLNGKQGFPAGDPRDPVFQQKTDAYNRIQVGLRNAQLDDSCLAAHPAPATYLCADVPYAEMNHITTPFFQMMDLSDHNVADLSESAGDPSVTPAKVAQRIYDQLGELANIRNTAIEKSAITIAPGASARNCGEHVVWSSDDGFFGKWIREAPGTPAYSFFDLLTNWMTGKTPTSVRSPRPPDSPIVPLTEPTCNSKAPDASASPSIATVSSANYLDLVAPESIVTTFGSNLAATTALATTIPYPTNLGGVTVLVTDSASAQRAAPIYYVSPTQVSFLIPAGTATGTARIRIGSQNSTVTVAATAPGIYSANSQGKGVAAATFIRITARGDRSEGLLFDAATKADVGVPAAAGDQIYLILYGTGMRGGRASATVGGVEVPVAGPAAQSQYPGLDQINLGPLPLRIGYGQKQIVIRQGDGISNVVTVTFRQP